MRCTNGSRALPYLSVNSSVDKHTPRLHTVSLTTYYGTPASAHAGQKLRTRGDSDALHSALQNALLLQARSFEQFVLYEWYPSQWGAGSASDPLQHSSVVQEVTPSRTGLHALKSTAVVYRQRGEWEIGG
jgi:hypothetical protein